MVDVGTDPGREQSARPEGPAGETVLASLSHNLPSIKITAVQQEVTGCLHYAMLALQITPNQVMFIWFFFLCVFFFYSFLSP